MLCQNEGSRQDLAPERHSVAGVVLYGATLSGQQFVNVDSDVTQQ
jgi:hypothetical protein